MFKRPRAHASVVTSPQPAGESPISPIAYRLVAHFALDMPRMPSEASGHIWQLLLQAVDEFNYVMPKAITPIFIDVRSSSLHCLVATDATFFSDELDCLVDDVDFVHFISPLVLETFVTHLIVPFPWSMSSLLNFFRIVYLRLIIKFFKEVFFSLKRFRFEVNMDI